MGRKNRDWNKAFMVPTQVFREASLEMKVGELLELLPPTDDLFMFGVGSVGIDFNKLPPDFFITIFQ